jgi:hypothetical protein
MSRLTIIALGIATLAAAPALAADPENGAKVFRKCQTGSVATFWGGRGGAADRRLQAAAPNRAATKALWAGMSLAGIAETCPLRTIAMIS